MSSGRFGILTDFLKRMWVAEALLFILASVVHLWSLMRYPFPFVDEAWFASRAWSFINTGRAFGTLDAGVFNRFPGHETYFPWLPVWLQSLGLRLFPQPELLGIRLVSLFFGMVLLVLIYAIGVRFGGRRLGLLGGFMLSFSTPFFYSAHLGRYDVIVSAFGFAAIFLYLKQRPSKTFIPSLLVGLLAVLAFEIHANGVIYTPVLLLLFVWEMGWGIFRSHGFWGFVVGGGAGALFYLERHILRFPETYFDITRLAFSPTHIPPILTLDLQVMLDGLISTHLVFTIFLVLLPVIVMGAVHLVIRTINTRKKDEVLLLLLSLALVAAYGLFIRQKHIYYAILVAPILIIVASKFMLDTWQPWRGNWIDYVNRISWGLALASVVYVLMQNQFDTFALYRPVQDRITQHVRSGEVLMGPQTYWFGLYDHKYYSWETIIYYERLVPGSAFADAMSEFNPDIFILDGLMYNFINDLEYFENSYDKNLHIPLDEVRVFLRDHAILVDSFSSEVYGPVHVYRINWD